MNYIIIDLEWNTCTKKTHFPEISEIGAIKVKNINGKLTLGKTFHSHVRPTFTKINKKTKTLTGIKTTDIWLAPKLPKVIDRFNKWIGKEQYIICTWSSNDIPVLIKNCNRYNLSTEWINKYIDIQKHFSKVYNKSNKNLIGLIKGLELVGLKFKGRTHSAISDAVNTADLFIEVFSNLNLKKQSANTYKYREELRQISKNKKRIG